MKLSIVLKDGIDDNYTQNIDGQALQIDSFWNCSEANKLRHDIFSIMEKYKLAPSEPVIDFVNISQCIYAIDQLYDREKYGYYGWGRHFSVHIPVINVEKWNAQKGEIENLFSFLSGDKYELTFRRRNSFPSINQQLRVNNISGVSLLSGGLDSFLGAIDLLEKEINTVFVSHHKSGNSGDLTTQGKLFSSFKSEYPKRDIEHYKFFVQPSNIEGEKNEQSQRARSIIFIALGILAANSYGTEIPLYVPENGFISLNVPLVSTRAGSLSTKTTHPQFIGGLNALLSSLDIRNKIINPFQFFTKGEMIAKCSNKGLVKRHLKDTISCSKAGYYSQWHNKSDKHCGFCAPCIIRRAAVHAARMEKSDCGYVYDVNNKNVRKDKTQGVNVGIYKNAYQRLKNEDLYFEIIKSGNLPGGEKEINEFISIFGRGLSEIEKFLQ